MAWQAIVLAAPHKGQHVGGRGNTVDERYCYGCMQADEKVKAEFPPAHRKAHGKASYDCEESLYCKESAGSCHPLVVARKMARLEAQTAGVMQ